MGLNKCKGQQRISQQKEISQYLKYSKIGNGNSVIVDEIYKTPLPSQDKRHQLKYDNQRQFNILLQNLFEQCGTEQTFTGTKSALYRQMCCFPTDIYMLLWNNENKISGKKYSNESIRFLQQVLYDICNKKCMERILKYKQHMTVDYDKCYELKFAQIEEETAEQTIKKEIYYEDEDEYNEIYKIETELLKELGIKRKAELYYGNKISFRQYYIKFNEKVKQAKNCVECFSKIEISPQKFKIVYTDEELCSAMQDWQRFIYDCVKKRCDGMIGKRKEKLDEFKKRESEIISEDLQALICFDSLFTSDDELVYRSDDIPFAQELKAEIKKIKSKYPSEETSRETSEILNFWNSIITKS